MKVKKDVYKRQGLAVIWLYERMKNGEFKHGIFKEKDIHHAFEAVSLIKGCLLYTSIGIYLIPTV